jgi:DNA topoisomerase-2
MSLFIQHNPDHSKYRLKDFINNDLKIFSNADNVRSIPSIVDGFKDSQRKAVYGMFTHGTSEIKVAQLGSHGAKVTAYQHGENSLCETIVKLAQDFPGSNNVNLFTPIGQFGSIMSSEASAVRYIYTKPSPYMRKYLHRDDDLLLESRMEEGKEMEPLNYFPIIPFWLVNGAQGVGTGHASKILSRDPKKVADLMKKLLQGVAVQQRTIDAAMTPYFGAWGGEVVKGASDTQWEFHGRIEKINTTTLKVTHLPITYDVDKFKEILIKLMDDGKVKDFDNNSTEDGFEFIITVPREVARKEIVELKSIFKLVHRFGENVTLWNIGANLQRFDNVYAALLAFIEFRKGIYVIRKQKLLEAMAEDLKWNENKVKFITYWNSKMKDPHKKKRSELEAEFSAVVDLKYMDRLLAMQISSLTMEKVAEAEQAAKGVKADIETLEKTSTDALFIKDLDAL